MLEVLSARTAAYERGKKFELYRQDESIPHYLVLEQSRPHAELFCRTAQGLWVLHPLGPDDSIQIDQPHASTCPVAVLFEGVPLDAPAGATALAR